MQLRQFRWGAALAMATTIASCADETTPPPGASSETGVLAARKAAPSDDSTAVSAQLASLDSRLAATGARVRVLKAEFILRGDGYQPAAQTVYANDRARGLGYEWVAGDPRRDGRIGILYAIDPRQTVPNATFGSLPVTRNPDGSGLRALTFSELEAQLVAGENTWRDRPCSSAPVDRVAVPAGVDPDFLDEMFLGLPETPGYTQFFDVVQGGWQPAQFFRAIAGGPSGDNIIGVTFSFIWVDDNGDPTDIDGDGNADTALAEIYYNTLYAWGSTGAANVVDTYSIVAHETGHSFGLAHFGKVFVTGNDRLHRSPEALMNAVYVGGEETVRGTDNSSFCQIWASKN
jgi:hypothetical protein